MPITVATFFQDKNEDLKLELVSGIEGIQREIKVSEINRPGLAFTGYFEHFASERIQIIGIGEHAYLKAFPAEQQTRSSKKYFLSQALPA